MIFVGNKNICCIFASTKNTTFMDKLINYIEYRRKRYGEIERITALSSMYYCFGNIKVRISDHMKYSNDAVKKIDYYFIIQPNGTYIFMPNPKYNKDEKMYMKRILSDMQLCLEMLPEASHHCRN